MADGDRAPNQARQRMQSTELGETAAAGGVFREMGGQNAHLPFLSLELWPQQQVGPEQLRLGFHSSKWHCRLRARHGAAGILKAEPGYSTLQAQALHQAL